MLLIIHYYWKMHKKLTIIGIAALFLIVSCGTQELVRDIPQEKKPEIYPTQGLMHFMYGEIYRTEGNYVYANMEYRRALQYDTTATILKAVGESYLQMGKRELAADYYEEALRIDPNDESLRYSVIELYMNELRYDEAISMLEKSLEDNPEDGDFLQKLAESYRQTGRFNKAIETLDKLIELDPKYPWPYLYAAEIMLEDARIADAAPYLDKVARRVPPNNELYEFWVRALFESKNIDGMLSALEFWLDQDPETLAPYFLFMDYQFQLDHYDKANAVLDRISHRWNEDGRISYFQGLSAMQKDEPDSVMFFFERAKGTHDVGSDLFLYFGLWFWKKGDLDAAEYIADNAIEIRGPEARWLHMKAMINAQKGQFDLAADLLRQILKGESGNVNAKEDLANIYIEIGNSDKAVELYSELLEAMPGDPGILNNYAYALARLDRDLNKAMDMVNKALKQEKSAAYCDTKAWILYRQGKYKKALIWIGKAMAYPPSGSDVHYHHGRILEKLGKLDEAKNAYQTSLQIDPDNTQSIKALEELK